MVGLAVAFFLWGVTKFVIAADDEKARSEAKGMMVYGIIGILVVVSIWGIISVLGGIFSLNTNPNTSDGFRELIP
jgi:predicted nucleic acid-binding protein